MRVVAIGQIPLQENHIAVPIIPARFKHRVRKDDAGCAIILHAEDFSSDGLDESHIKRAGGFVADGDELANREGGAVCLTERGIRVLLGSYSLIGQNVGD